MLSSGEWHKAEATRHYPLSLNVDVNSMEWLRREAKRTGLDVELVATTLLRKSCAEETELSFGPKA